MSNNSTPGGSPWKSFSGPNLGYVVEMYDLYTQTPDAVDPELVALFQQYGSPLNTGETTGQLNSAQVEPSKFGKVLSAIQLADAIRVYGHLSADIYPLNDQPKDVQRLEFSYYGLTESDLLEVPVN